MMGGRGWLVGDLAPRYQKLMGISLARRWKEQAVFDVLPGVKLDDWLGGLEAAEGGAFEALYADHDEEFRLKSAG